MLRVEDSSNTIASVCLFYGDNISMDVKDLFDSDKEPRHEKTCLRDLRLYPLYVYGNYKLPS